MQLLRADLEWGSIGTREASRNIGVRRVIRRPTVHVTYLPARETRVSPQPGDGEACRGNQREVDSICRTIGKAVTPIIPRDDVDLVSDGTLVH